MRPDLPSTITAVAYDSTANTITLTGTNFDQIESASTDIKGQLAWDKFTWDIDGDGASTSGLTFVASDITSAIKTSATQLTITLASAGQTKITNALAAGFGADAIGTNDAANAADNVDISAGFIVDDTGNASTTDAASNLSPTYSDNVAPTISSFSTSTSDGSYGIGDTVNITATTSETVLKGSAITATLNNNVNVVLTAGSNGTSMVGTYTIQAGDSATTDLTVNSYTQTSSPVTDVYGNVMTSTTVPTGTNNIAGSHAIDIDASRPASTITAVLYNNDANTITLTGTNFDAIESAGSDIKAQLDWTKFNWDTDGDGATTAGLTFVASDITSAIKTSATQLTITLASGGQTKITNEAGFGADGIAAGTANTADNVDISAGFIVDDTGNASVTDAAANLNPVYSDATKPTVTSFTSDKTNGSYKAGVDINITANTSELVLKDSTITVTLDTSETVTLTAASNGTTMTGVYTVGAGFNSADLNVSSFALVDASGNASAVVDKFGNTLSDTSAPTGSNSLAGSKAIVIDTIPIVGANTTVPGSDVTQNDGNTTFDAGDSVALKFSETVANKSAVDAVIGAITALGTSASSVWSNSDKTVTITTDSDATIAQGNTIALTGVLDEAGNSNDITFTLDLT